MFCSQTSPMRPGQSSCGAPVRHERMVAGAPALAPQWDYCLEHECQARKEALRWIREEGFTLQAASWTTYHNDHHHMKQWVTHLAMTHKVQSPPSDNEELTKAPKEHAEFRRSTLKRGKGSPGAIQAPQFLALTVPSGPTPAPEQEEKRRQWQRKAVQ